MVIDWLNSLLKSPMQLEGLEDHVRYFAYMVFQPLGYFSEEK
jgi:hypothetical protein